MSNTKKTISCGLYMLLMSFSGYESGTPHAVLFGYFMLCKYQESKIMQFMLNGYGVKNECLSKEMMDDVDTYLKAYNIQGDRILYDFQVIMSGSDSKCDKNDEYRRVVRGYDSNTDLKQIITDAVEALDVKPRLLSDDETQNALHSKENNEMKNNKNNISFAKILQKYSDALDKLTEENNLLTEVTI